MVANGGHGEVVIGSSWCRVRALGRAPRPSEFPQTKNFSKEERSRDDRHARTVAAATDPVLRIAHTVVHLLRGITGRSEALTQAWRVGDCGVSDPPQSRLPTIFRTMVRLPQAKSAVPYVRTATIERLCGQTQPPLVPMMPSAMSWSMWPAETPAESSVARVCSPTLGWGRCGSTSAVLNFIGFATVV